MDSRNVDSLHISPGESPCRVQTWRSGYRTGEVYRSSHLGNGSTCPRPEDGFINSFLAYLWRRGLLNEGVEDSPRSLEGNILLSPLDTKFPTFQPCSSSSSPSNSVPENDFEFLTLLPLLPTCWDNTFFCFCFYFFSPTDSHYVT